MTSVDHEIVVRTVLEYIDGHKDEVSAWKSQQLGLEKFLAKTPLVTSRKNGEAKGKAHTWTSLGALLRSTVAQERPAHSTKTLKDLFTEGLDVLSYEYLARLGLRPMVAEKDGKPGELAITAIETSSIANRQ